jgi:SAM-dependent methyltransferase
VRVVFRQVLTKLSQTPVFSPLTKGFARVYHVVSGRDLRMKRHDHIYSLSRVDPRQPPESQTADQARITNLLNYTKTSGAHYSADEFPAGYHSVQIGDLWLRGQRDPAERLRHVPYDFTGKSVLDLGCNQGGSLIAIRDRISWAVGIDYDHRMINVANRIGAYLKAENISFYVLDLEKEPLALIDDLIIEHQVSITFLLSVCMWISNWKAVLRYAASVSESMLFESNGSELQQSEQEREIRSVFPIVQKLSDTAPDDPTFPRKLFLCHHHPLAQRTR